MARLSEGIPRDVEPIGADEELVGVLADLQKIHEWPKLCRGFRTDVGSLTDEVLGIAYTAHFAIYGLRAEAGIDNNRTYDKSGRL